MQNLKDSLSTMTDDLKEKLKKFFEENPLAKQAADSIHNGRVIKIIIKTENADHVFSFSKQMNKNVLTEQNPDNPDLTFIIPIQAAQEILESTFTTVGQIGIRIFEKMLSQDPSQKIQAKVHAGLLSLITGGYLGVLTAGGAEVTKFLATKGLGNLNKIKEAISKMRGT